MNATADMRQNVDVVRLDESRMEQLLAIQESVCSNLEMPELYFPVSAEEMREFFESDGLCFGVECGSQLVGFFGVLFMKDRLGNVGHDLGLSKSDLANLAYFKAVNVLTQYRGMGLQKKLTQALLAHLGAELVPGLSCFVESKGPTKSPSINNAHPSRVLCSTVSPLNISSLKSFMDCGFWIAGLRPKYNGYMRYLLIRKTQIVKFNETDSVSVSSQDYATQISLLDRGMLGVQLCTNPVEGPKIKYVRPPISDSMIN